MRPAQARAGSVPRHPGALDSTGTIFPPLPSLLSARILPRIAADSEFCILHFAFCIFYPSFNSFAPGRPR
jgi:hypothetical protein